VSNWAQRQSERQRDQSAAEHQQPGQRCRTGCGIEEVYSCIESPSHSFVLQNSDLNAAILGATLCRLVVGNGLGITKSEGLDQPSQIQTMHADSALNTYARSPGGSAPCPGTQFRFCDS